VIVLLLPPKPAASCSPPDGTHGPPGRKWDARLFGIGAQILRALGVGKMRLLASPRKIPSMTGFGLEITGYFDELPAGEA
jgi:3,4-dihydroxy 2-butanone 4-phosphate synthase/GTP cyclohydrolase II